MEPLLLMSLLLLGMTSTFNALEDEVSVRLKQGMVSCNNLEILGRDPATKLDDFLEKFQTAFDPPPPLIFGKLYCKLFIMDMVAFMQGGIGQIVSVKIS